MMRPNVSRAARAVSRGVLVVAALVAGPLHAGAQPTLVDPSLDEDDEDDEDDPLEGLSDDVKANVRRIFAYGVRNSFGMTFDPKKGDMWTTENGGRSRLKFTDPRLKDKVADNLPLDDFTTEGEEILSGSNFGTVTSPGPVPSPVRS